MMENKNKSTKKDKNSEFPNKPLISDNEKSGLNENPFTQEKNNLDDAYNNNYQYSNDENVQYSNIKNTELSNKKIKNLGSVALKNQNDKVFDSNKDNKEINRSNFGNNKNSDNNN